MGIPTWSWPIVVLALAGTACHARPPVVAPSRTAAAVPPVVAGRPATASATPAPPAPAARPPAAPPSEAELFNRKTLDELNAEHPLVDAFFDYDQKTLRDDARAALQKDAEWLLQWPQTSVNLEGYCDERGTPEYNLALGAQRATVAKAYLEGLGVNPSRIRTVSLGKERPFCLESTEDCWAKNRRGHFVIIGK